MAKYAVRLATIQQVRDHYDSVKPIRGTTTRPMGFRGRKWEEIRKVDDNTFHIGMTEWGSQGFQPIVTWQEVGSKTEVTITNGCGEHAHMSVYAFLDYFLPLGMRLIVKSGKQFIQREADSYDSTGDYLPKGTYDRETSEVVAKPITYSRPTATCKSWVLTSKPYTLPRKLVDKERKAEYKQGISEFVEWAWTMVPIIGDEYRKTWNETAIRRRSVSMYAEGGTGFMRLLVDSTNEARFDILCEFIQEANDNAHGYWDRDARRHVRVNPISDPKKFRAKLNSFINKYGEFTNITIKH